MGLFNEADEYIHRIREKVKSLWLSCNYKILKSFFNEEGRTQSTENKIKRSLCLIFKKNGFH